MAHSHDTPVADYIPACFRCEAERKLVGLRNLVRRASLPKLTPNEEEDTCLSGQVGEGTGFDLKRWRLQQGACPYDGGSHEFLGAAPKRWCRLCRADESFLKGQAARGFFGLAD